MNPSVGGGGYYAEKLSYYIPVKLLYSCIKYNAYKQCNIKETNKKLQCVTA